MYLSVGGIVKYGPKSEPGQLLFTDQSLFVLRAVEDWSRVHATIHGGLLGALVWRYRDSRRKIEPPEHLADPELAQLDDKLRKQLLKTSLVARLQLADILQVKNTRLGFEFSIKGQLPLYYAGWMRKNAVRGFLEGHGIPIDG